MHTNALCGTQFEIGDHYNCMMTITFPDGKPRYSTLILNGFVLI